MKEILIQEYKSIPINKRINCKHLIRNYLIKNGNYCSFAWNDIIFISYIVELSRTLVHKKTAQKF